MGFTIHNIIDTQGRNNEPTPCQGQISDVMTSLHISLSVTSEQQNVCSMSVEFYSSQRADVFSIQFSLNENQGISVICREILDQALIQKTVRSLGIHKRRIFVRHRHCLVPNKNEGYYCHRKCTTRSNKISTHTKRHVL